MFGSGNTTGIIRHLSNLRMNGQQNRQDLNSPESNIPTPSELKESSTSDKQIPQNLTTEGSDELLSNDFDPNDVKSYPPDFLNPGIDMIRVTRRKIIKRQFKLDLSDFSIQWNTKESSKLFIDKIKSIRIGKDAKNYREEFNISNEFNDAWITVIYVSTKSKSSNFTLGNDLKALHMIAPTKRNFELLYETLTMLHRWSLNQESLINCANIKDFSSVKWNSKTKDRKSLNLNEVVKMCNELHIYMDVSYIENYFKACDVNDKGALTFEEFQSFVSMLRNRDEFQQIFLQLSISKGKMNREEFGNFLRDIQGEGMTVKDIDTLFKKFSFMKNNEYMTPHDLSNYLSSKYSTPCIMEDSKSDYYSLPITDYFIASSHNTYLLGKQVHGNSSIEGYIHALQRGCRCIEIDIWDNNSTGNGVDTNPVVTHGHTFTTSVDLKLVVDTIRKYAFIASPYPLLLSLEIRCSFSSQLKTVEILKETFGDMLILTSLDNKAILPSPNDLKHKVLVKVKKSELTTYEEPSLEKVYPSFSTTSSQSDATDDSTTFNTITKKKKKTQIAHELTSIAPYMIGVKFRNFSLPESKTFNHVFSFSDRTLKSMMQDETKLISILKHNRRGLMRVYPSVLRYKSDNFNPILFWNTGCQMVATNWQLWDCGEELCESFFKNTGSVSDVGYSGYRKKPEHMRSIKPNQDKADLKRELLRNLEFNIEKSIDISIISGQQLPKPKDSSSDYTPWIEIKYYNVKPISGDLINTKNKGTVSTNDSVDTTIPEDSALTNFGLRRSSLGIVKLKYVDQTTTDPNHDAVFKTKCAENSDNLFNPIWNITSRLKYLTNINDFSFIRIIVKSNIKSKSNVIKKVGNVVVKSPSSCIIGSWCCRLSDLKNGYRHIRLVDNHGDELIYSTLFIKIAK